MHQLTQLLQESREVIAWVANQRVADLLIEKKIIIESCEDVKYPVAPSVYIHCALKRQGSIDRNMVVNYIRNVAADKFADIYHQSTGILVQLKNRESSEGYNLLTYSLILCTLTNSLITELLKNLEEVFELAIASFRIIYTSEFTYINFHVLPPANHRDNNDSTGLFIHLLANYFKYSLIRLGLITNCVEEYVKTNNLGEVNDVSLTHMIRSYLASHSDHPAVIHAAIGTYLLTYSVLFTTKMTLI